MGLAALVMAGGKATRMCSKVEKPLLRIVNKPMITYVIEALRKSKSVDRIIVAVSSETPRTARMAIKLGVEVTETRGYGYEEDMKQAIKAHSLSDVVVVSADLPFLTSEVVDEAVNAYLENGKPSLMVAATLEMCKQTGIEPSYVFEVAGRKVVPVGLNVIDGERIDEPELDEEIFITQRECLTVNVNTSAALQTARRRLQV